MKITVHQSDSNSIRSKETSPSIEIDFIIDETNEEVHFERIGSLGYHYIVSTYYHMLVILRVFYCQKRDIFIRKVSSFGLFHVILDKKIVFKQEKCKKKEKNVKKVVDNCFY